MTESYIESSIQKSDEPFELPLRPSSIDSFIGQESIKERLKILIFAAKERNDPVGHILFSGPPGLGKTTLSHIISKSMESNIVSSSGPVLEKPGDLAGILTNLKKGDVFFIDEIHRIPKTTEEYLYSAIEDFSLDLLIDQGPNARSVQVKLQPFTLVGATTKSGLLSAPLRSRFLSTFRLDFYLPEILQKIVLRSAKLMNLTIDNDASYEIAKRARGTPRIANNLLKWVRDYAQNHQSKKLTLSIAKKALKMLSIDNLGLDEMDIKILNTICKNYEGGPVGIQTIAVAIGEESSTISEVYEPYLILQGLLKRTPRGREVTKLGYEHLGYSIPKKIKSGEYE
jgi:holliday junction DNA helicase RuvB